MNEHPMMKNTQSPNTPDGNSNPTIAPIKSQPLLCPLDRYLRSTDGLNGFRMAAFLACIIGLFASGCITPHSHPHPSSSRQGYIGSALPDSQTSVVTGQQKDHPDPRVKYTTVPPYEHPYENIIFHKVDDLVVGNANNGWGDEMRVLPGRRTIELSYFNSRIQDSGTGLIVLGIFYARIHALPRYVIELDAQPGRRYEVKFNSDGRRLINDDIWIEEVAPAGGVVVGKARKLP